MSSAKIITIVGAAQEVIGTISDRRRCLSNIAIKINGGMSFAKEEKIEFLNELLPFLVAQRKLAELRIMERNLLI